MKSNFSRYQQQYMNDRFGKGWATEDRAVMPSDELLQQTAFCSFIYASVRSLIDLFK